MNLLNKLTISFSSCPTVSKQPDKSRICSKGGWLVHQRSVAASRYGKVKNKALQAGKIQNWDNSRENYSLKEGVQAVLLFSIRGKQGYLSILSGKQV